MLFGAAVLAAFAAIWAMLGLWLDHGASVFFGGAVVTSAALFAAAARKAKTLPPRSEAEGERIGKLVMTWSAIEGVGIFVAVNIAANLGHRELMPVAGGIAVALHFIPLARGMPQPVYYGTAAAMLAAALAAIAAPAVVTPALFCMAAAVILWATLAVVIRRA